MRRVYACILTLALMVHLTPYAFASETEEWIEDEILSSQSDNDSSLDSFSNAETAQEQVLEEVLLEDYEDTTIPEDCGGG